MKLETGKRVIGETKTGKVVRGILLGANGSLYLVKDDNEKEWFTLKDKTEYE